jgi:toxin FitB
MTKLIYLADTNVLSELVKINPDAQVMRWLQGVERLTTSVVTIEEANFGLAWQASLRKLQLFNRIIESLHAVYPITESIARRAGILRGQFQAQGITRSTPEMLIAATALEHQLIVVTRNLRDFTACGVQVINPFTAQA